MSPIKIFQNKIREIDFWYRMGRFNITEMNQELNKISMVLNKARRACAHDFTAKNKECSMCGCTKIS